MALSSVSSQKTQKYSADENFHLFNSYPIFLQATPIFFPSKRLPHIFSLILVFTFKTHPTDTSSEVPWPQFCAQGRIGRLALSAQLLLLNLLKVFGAWNINCAIFPHLIFLPKVFPS